MKSIKFPYLLCLLILGLSAVSTAQVDIQGSTSGSSGFTLITSNANTPPDTTVYIRDDGNVGIGTLTPGAKLDVNGLINAGAGIQYPDGTIQTSALTAGVSYANVFTVATSGGDFTLVSLALAACTSPSASNRYLIRVMPGIYVEPGGVFCQSYVDLSGSGKNSAVINGTVFGADSCVIENFFIKQGIVCNGTSPFILHNIITRSDADNATGIFITDAEPWIKENEIQDCPGWGIYNLATLESTSFGEGWILANKIVRNGYGGIICENTSPTISNNIIDENENYGIYLIGVLNKPAEPTIDDNVVGHTSYTGGGRGIYMQGFAEPRIIANDIFLNECGIWIDANTQPSIIGNNINYNFEAGIRCYSNGASKRPVISFNHLHSNAHNGGSQPAGVWIQDSNVILTQNNITQNDANLVGLPDLDYSLCTTSYPTISLNVYDNINRSTPPATGMYNATSGGIAITP